MWLRTGIKIIWWFSAFAFLSMCWQRLTMTIRVNTVTTMIHIEILPLTRWDETDSNHPLTLLFIEKGTIFLQILRCLHTHMLSYMLPCLHVSLHAYILTCLLAYILTCLLTALHCYMLTCLLTCSLTCLHASMLTCLHACLHTYMLTCLHAYMLAYILLTNYKHYNIR